MSLKSNLNQIIKDRNGGIFTLQELEVFCKNAQYKLSNAERRLRPSESPNIERVMKNGAIVGYKYIEVQSANPAHSRIPDWFFDTRPKQVIKQRLF